MTVKEYQSPCGTLTLGAEGNFIVMCRWGGAGTEDGDSAVIEEAIRQLDAYFSGSLKVFDLPLRFYGTDFQKEVWQALCDIPCGQTVSYSAVARRLGRPLSVRAVANAVGKNPINIICPCHRVIGSDGSLTGYAGGFGAKKMLLELETELFGGFDGEGVGA